MNGAEALVRTLAASGVEVCFANPGTSEMHFVSALDGVAEMRAVLCLFEGVATGAADGYGRMARKPAATLLHLGAGLGNGIANLHNARRAATPIVNIVGDHATYHAQYDAPLASDIKGLAAPVSGWVHASQSALQVAADGARAVAAAMTPPGQIATLILPADTAWKESGLPARPVPRVEQQTPGDDIIDDAAKKLKNGKATALLLRGAALQEEGLRYAGRIAEKTGARLLCDTFPPRMRRGAGMVAIERLPYFGEQVVEAIADIDQMILVGSKPPISFFAYPDKPSWLAKNDCAFFVLAHPHQDDVAALGQLADALQASAQRQGAAMSTELPNNWQAESLDQFSVGKVLAHLLPEEAIIVDDGATSGLGSFTELATAPPHDYLALTGGAIGIGMPMAVGAALACPARKVVNLEGDGSGMYTLQALWTQAREQLNIVNIVFANRSYAILNIELHRVGANAGPKALSVLDLSQPTLDWVRLSEGMGVEASRAETIEAFAEQLKSAMAQKAPRLIEVVL